MFERFTERARQVVVLAQDEARHFGQANITTDSILLGLIREEDGVAHKALKNCGVTLDRVRSYIEGGDAVTTGQLPFTPHSKKVLELSLREALHLGHNYIGTEHILLGLLRQEYNDEDVFAHDILAEIVGEYYIEIIRDEVLKVLGPRAKPVAEQKVISYTTTIPLKENEEKRMVIKTKNATLDIPISDFISIEVK